MRSWTTGTPTSKVPATSLAINEVGSTVLVVFTSERAAARRLADVKKVYPQFALATRARRLKL
jgi:hypothetical protein